MCKKDGAGVVLYKDETKEEIFLVRRNDIPLWQIPGGGVEKGETFKEASIRETIEETGLDFEISKLLGKLIIKNLLGQSKRVGYIYEGFHKSGEYVPEYNGCLGGWYRLDNLPKGLSYYSKKVLKKISGGSKIPFDDTLVYTGYLFNIEVFLLNPICTVKFIVKKLPH